MLRARRTEDGIVGFNLVVFLAFVLFAVVELTRTTITAQQINTTVKNITGSVSSAEHHLRADPELDKTNATAAQILVAAKPLTGQADQIIQAAHSIDGTVTQILGNAQAINSTVHSINSTVHSINSAAVSINGLVHSIDGTFVALLPVTQSIQAGVADINRRADRVLAPVQGIHDDLSNVLGLVGSNGDMRSIDGQANNIDCVALVHGGACGQ